MVEKTEIITVGFILTMMFLIIITWPIEEDPVEIRIISGTAINDWGYSADYCDNMWDFTEEQLDEHTKQVTFYKSYCSI